MDKYRKLFDLSKYVIDEQIELFFRIDEKASEYLSVLTLLFGVAAFVCKWSLDNFLPLKSAVDYLGIISVLVFLILLSCSWYFSFRALKIDKLRVMPINEEMILFFYKNTLVDIYYALSKRFAAAYRENRLTIKRKVKYITKSYMFIIYSFIVALLVFLSIGIKAYNKN